MGKRKQPSGARGEPCSDGLHWGANCDSGGDSLGPAVPALGQQAFWPAGTSTECAQATLRRLPRAGPDSWRAWAERRGRWKHSSELVGRGNSPGSHVALRRESCATVVCRRAGCAALVHLHSARRRARAEGRDSFASGDGCAGPCCSRNWRRSQFAASQRRMAAALVAGKRFLAPWPTSCDNGNLHYFPAAAAAAAAAAAVAGL